MDGGLIATLIVAGMMALVIIADITSPITRSMTDATVARNRMWQRRYGRDSEDIGGAA